MASILNVSIHSDISEFPTEKRYDANIKISELKKKLELITGANHTSMKISLAIDSTQFGEVDNDDETLGHYLGDQLDKRPSLNLYVKDEQPSNIFSSDVPKYTISEDKYTERRDNARNFIKEKRKSGQ